MKLFFLLSLLCMVGLAGMAQAQSSKEDGSIQRAEAYFAGVCVLCIGSDF